MDGLLDHELHHTATVHHGGGNGRIRVHPAVLSVIAAVLIAVASALTGYYRGLLEEQQKNGDLAARVAVLEERSKETHDSVAEIKLDMREVKHLLEARTP